MTPVPPLSKVVFYDDHIPKHLFRYQINHLANLCIEQKFFHIIIDEKYWKKTETRYLRKLLKLNKHKYIIHFRKQWYKTHIYLQNYALIENEFWSIPDKHLK